MNQYFRIIFFLFSSLFLCFCSEQKDTSQEIKKPKDSLLAPSLELTENQIAKPPIIIRSPAPHFKGLQQDTNQISQYIRCIYQDKKGNLWFGTVGEGVCRYNGKYLTYFTEKEGFSGNSVQGIAEDKDGNLWFGTTGGVTKYEERFNSDSAKATFTNFTEKDGLTTNHTWSLFKDRNENIWIGTAGGLCRYNPYIVADMEKGKNFMHISVPATSGKPQLRSIIEDRTGNIWLGSMGEGVYRYDGKTFKHISENEGLPNNTVHALLQDREGNFWFGTQNGLCRYDASAEFKAGAKAFTTYTLEKGSNQIGKLFEDIAGNLWVVLRTSLRRYNPSPGTYRNGKAGENSFIDFNAADGLTNWSVQSIYEDRAGTLWFGSGAGLFRLDKSRVNHPCVKRICKHDLKIEKDLKEHDAELAQTFINVTKKGPWPLRFR